MHPVDLPQFPKFHQAGLQVFVFYLTEPLASLHLGPTLIGSGCANGPFSLWAVNFKNRPAKITHGKLRKKYLTATLPFF